eukprot:TRINITY_DN16742_c0_g2_i1.p1 TRINITY_DN16742_c0_g2~~TRINITY_DN16742_c0_g2_i1.p1  ORF type:complete len:757 (-),score=72.99 TRINITY_DN16742_c0_g2_i1:174-2444(-)
MRRFSRRYCGPLLLVLAVVIFVVALRNVSFIDYGEVDLSLPVCTKDLCSNGSTEKCRYTDSPCRGKYCNKDCKEWYHAVVDNDGVPLCTCEKFCKGACYTPTCTSCKREELPLWIQDIAGPLGTGLLCCPLGGSPGNPEACCAQGHKDKYNSCCELEQKQCDCSESKPITISSFDPRGITVGGAFLAFAILAPLALMSCRRPLPKSVGPRGADLLLVVAYSIALAVAAVEGKRKWQQSFKPADLMPAGLLGSLAAFAFAVVLLPLDRTNVLLWLTRIPFERAVKFHRWAGYAAVALVVSHGLWETWVLGLATIITFEFKPYGFGNAFGVISGLSALALVCTSVWRARRQNYELFLLVHRILAATIFVAGCLHCFAFASLAAVVGLLHFAGIIARRLRRTTFIDVSRSSRLGAEEVDGEALLLEVPYQRHVGSSASVNGASLEKLPIGSWFLVQAVGSTQWHPYTVASVSPEKNTVTFLVKNMGAGSWSSRVVSSPPRMLRLEGPYGGPGYFPGHCSGLVLIAGGVGLTAVARLWQQIPDGVSRVDLIWVTRSPESVDWLPALLPGFDKPRSCGSSIQVFVTRQSTRLRVASVTWAAGVSNNDSIVLAEDAESQPSFQETAEPNIVQPDRPDADLREQLSPSSGINAQHESLEIETDFQRQTTWEDSVQATAESSRLAQQAAVLSWDPHAQPTEFAPHIKLKSGRPHLPSVFSKLRESGDISGTWGVIACGPRLLVEQARRCAAENEFRFHAEEFAW